MDNRLVANGDGILLQVPLETVYNVVLNPKYSGVHLKVVARK